MTSFPSYPMLERATMFGYRIECDTDNLTQGERAALRAHNEAIADAPSLYIEPHKPDFDCVYRTLGLNLQAGALALLRRAYELRLTVRELEFAVALAERIASVDKVEAVDVRHYAEACQYAIMNAQRREGAL